MSQASLHSRYTFLVRRLLPVMLVALLALLAACADGGEPAPQPTINDAAEVAPATSGPSAVLATGTIAVVAANSFDDPGFHLLAVVNATLPADLSPTSGRQLVLTLRDSSRPDQTCARQHPLSGCVTIDWSDAPGRSNVPPGGVFDNHIALSVGGAQSVFFLHEDGRLDPEPETFDPG